MATINQLLILTNLESYNAVLINQGKTQKERMKLLRQLVVQQLQTLDSLNVNSLTKLELRELTVQTKEQGYSQSTSLLAHKNSEAVFKLHSDGELDS